MGKIIKNNVTYGGVPDEVITAWETEDVQDLSEIEYGDADISGIGDGSITGAIAEHESDINDIDNTIGNTNISSIGDGTVTGAISTLNSKSSDFLITRVYSSNSFTLNQYGITNVSLSVGVTGYTPIGVVTAYFTDTAIMSITRYYFNSQRTQLNLDIVNNYNASRTSAVQVGVLYMKNI